MKKEIKVYAENLHEYNYGRSRGEWIRLGMEEDELRRILEERIGVTKEHPDIGIFDSHADIEISEYGNIYDLNDLANVFKHMSEEQYKAFLDYCNAKDISEPEEMANVCLQIDDISYQHFPDWVQQMDISLEEKMGRTLCEQNGMTEELQRIGAGGYFDYQAYGMDASVNDYELGDNGYFDKTDSLDLSYYSMQEIREWAAGQDTAGQTSGLLRELSEDRKPEAVAGTDQILGVDETRLKPDENIWKQEEQLEHPRLELSAEESMEFEADME